MQHAQREMKNAHKILVTEGKRSLGKLRCKWEENIRIDLKYAYKLDLTGSG
jgi:hypothetical protein